MEVPVGQPIPERNRDSMWAWNSSPCPSNWLAIEQILNKSLFNAWIHYISKKYTQVSDIVGTRFSCKKYIPTQKLIFISINIVIFEESFKNKNLLLITCLFLIILHLNLFISIGACWCGQIKDGNVFVIIKHAKIKYKGEKRVYVNNSLTQSIPVWYYSESTIPSDGAILVSYIDSLKRLNHIMCST